MAKCTAPITGHRTASGRANCPVCGRKSGRNLGSYYTTTYNRPSTGLIYNVFPQRPKWSPHSSAVAYSSKEIRTLMPFRESVEKRSIISGLKDVFLCHAWDDRKNFAKEICEILENNGVSVWFSEKDVPLGSILLREIDKGLANSKIGIVLVTPAFIERIKGEGIAEKELSALLARDLLIPIIHNTTFEKLFEVSPLLASRSGLSTAEDSIENIAIKISELVKI